MKRLLFPVLAALVVTLACSGAAWADSFTGAGNIIWTWTNEGPDSGTGFLVQLQVDASNPTAGDGTSIFNIMSVQLSLGSTNGVVSLVSTSANTSGWATSGPGNVNQCGGGNPPFYCSQTANGITITGGTNSGVYTFLFDVTGLTSAPDTGDVQALQGSLPGSNGNYNISHSFGVGAPPSVPEPSSLMMLGAGLLGLALLSGRRVFVA